MRSLSTFFGLLFISVLQAQPLQLNPSSLNFGSVDELDADSLVFSMVNNLNEPLRISKLHLPSIFGNEPFSLHSSSLNIAPQGSANLYIKLQAVHNVSHESALILETDSFFGCYALPLDADVSYSQSYYSSSKDLEGTALFNALRTRISSPYSSLSYNAARDNMYSSIDNVNGQVECVYTGRTATFSTRSGANSNNFNCEHTFPQGFFNSASPMKSDIHHLFPTDVNSNSQRGNLPFGVVSGSPTWQQGGSKMGGGKFEPRDVHKGVVARAMFYFVLRHQDYSNFLAGQESILRSWHEDYQPVSKDVDRNNAIAQLQQNRNPFVDYPQLIDRLGPFNQNGAMSTNEWNLYPDTLYMKYGVSAHIIINGRSNQNATLDVSDPQLQWNSAQGSGPFSDGLTQGDLSLNQNTSGSSIIDLKVGGITVDRMYVYYQPSGLSNEKYALPKCHFIPNPAQDQIELFFSQPKGEIQLVDMYGRVLLQREAFNATKLDLSYYSKGTYTLRMRVGESTWENLKLILH
jgi:endonuclease I